jgi:hypothetical protein
VLTAGTAILEPCRGVAKRRIGTRPARLHGGEGTHNLLCACQSDLICVPRLIIGEEAIGAKGGNVYLRERGRIREWDCQSRRRASARFFGAGNPVWQLIGTIVELRWAEGESVW